MNKLFFAAGAIAFVVVANAGTASAAGSCSSWKRTCINRCAGLGPQCKQNCETRAAQCKQSGCFYAAAEGKEYCGLKKN